MTTTPLPGFRPLVAFVTVLPVLLDAVGSSALGGSAVGWVLGRPCWKGMERGPDELAGASEIVEEPEGDSRTVSGFT